MNATLLLIGASLLWMLSELGLLLLRRADPAYRARGPGSVYRLNGVIYASLTAGIAVAMTGVGHFHVSTATLSWVGLVLLLAGICIRWTAILTLRKFFSVDVAVQSGHRLITNGIYRIVRHPSYAGAILSFTGIAFSLANWISGALILIPICLAFGRRITIEERALGAVFGLQYQEYCRDSWRMLPWIY